MLAVMTHIENRNGSGAVGCPAHAPRFPKGREEGWWLLVCCGERLMSCRRISSRGSMVTRVTVSAGDAVAEGLVLHVMSDCYVGLDVSLALAGSGSARCVLMLAAYPRVCAWNLHCH